MIKTICELKDYSAIDPLENITMESNDGEYIILIAGQESIALSVVELIEAIENCTEIRLNPSIVRWEVSDET